MLLGTEPDIWPIDKMAWRAVVALTSVTYSLQMSTTQRMRKEESGEMKSKEQCRPEFIDDQVCIGVVGNLHKHRDFLALDVWSVVVTESKKKQFQQEEKDEKKKRRSKEEKEEKKSEGYRMKKFLKSAASKSGHRDNINSRWWRQVKPISGPPVERMVSRGSVLRRKKEEEKKKVILWNTTKKRNEGENTFDSVIHIISDVGKGLWELAEQLDGRKNHSAVGVLQAVIKMVLSQWPNICGYSRNLK